MAQVTNTTAAVMIPESWYRDVQFARDDAFVAAGLVERRYESDLSVGDQVHIPFIADLTTEDISTAGTTMTPVANTETEVILSVDRFQGVAVEIWDKTKVQSKYSLDKAYSNRIGQALASAVDTDLLDFSGNTDVTVASGHDLTTVAAVTYDNVVSAVAVLDAANVPQGDRWMIVNAQTLGDLRKDANFVRYDSRGDKAAFLQGGGVAAIGEIYGIKVFLSNNVQLDTVPTPDDYLNIIGHKSWLALAVQAKPDLERHRNPLDSASYLIGRVLYGIKTIRDDHAVILRRQV